MRILVTNDDGLHAPGITILAEVLRQVAEVVVVAPDRERSAVAHALTLHHPLRVTQAGEQVFAVDGTPTDCVNLGIHTLLSKKPDLVVSGINCGANMGDDITYSGTVSAAMEATLMGIPAFAVSLDTRNLCANYQAAAEVAARLAQTVYQKGLPPDTFLNVNVPDLPVERLLPPIVTSQGKRRFEGSIIDKVDPRGRKYYWIGGSEASFMDIVGTDFHAVSRGHVSVTPLHLDLTNYAAMSMLQGWDLS